MEIIDIKPRGFCKGVIRSLLLAKQTRLNHPSTPITILGALVHNSFIVQALAYYDINTIHNPSKNKLELIDEIDNGIVIFSAHGISTQVIDKAIKKGLTVVDATCDDVLKTHQVIEQAIGQGYDVIYIGKTNHPESQAIIDNYPVHFITGINEIKDLKIDNNKIMVTNQTTLSILQIQVLYDEILKNFPYAKIENEICVATTIRQQAILKQHHLDALIVIGDPQSNNTAMLAEIGRENGIKLVSTIESVEQLNLSAFNDSMRIGITSGASTPSYLTNQVIDYLREYDFNHPTPLPVVDISRVLD